MATLAVHVSCLPLLLLPWSFLSGQKYLFLLKNKICHKSIQDIERRVESFIQCKTLLLV